MLISFSLSNFASFDQEQEFSMIPSAVTSHKNRLKNFDDSNSLLKFSALYGANASGKSNFTKALKVSRTMILAGISDMPTTEWHFKLIPERKEQDTRFEYEIEINGKYYSYGLEVNIKNKQIIKEWLYELTEYAEKELFARSIKDGEDYSSIKGLNFDSSEEQKEFEFLIKRVNELEVETLLSELARGRANKYKSNNILYDLINWFSEKLIIIDPNNDYPSKEFYFENNIQFMKMLKSFDTGITGVELRETSFKKLSRDIPSDIIARIEKDISKIAIKTKENLFLQTVDSLIRINAEADGSLVLKEYLFHHHNIENVKFEFGEESDGTKRIIQLINLFGDMDKGKTIVIDELDRSLHPKLTIQYVKEFLKLSESVESNSQLIITTHESALMDLDILRRDEIWFVERSKIGGSSELFSLEDFKVHRTKRIEKDYLFGRYGAVPIFTQCDFKKGV